jgi:ankyrin repeat protein
MEKKMVFGAIMTILLVLQAQTLFADYNDDFLKEVGKNDLKAMERILQRRANQMNLAYCTYSIMSGVNGLSTNNIIPILELLKRYGTNFERPYIQSGSDNRPPIVTLLMFNKSNDTVLFDVVQFLLRNGANPNDAYIFYLNGNLQIYETPLGASIDKPRIFNLLLENGADINARARINNDETLLIQASRNDNLAQIQILVGKGANVNLRATDGSTAASVAYDRGNIEIYDYLMVNGAREFEPRQVVQQPVAPAPSPITNVYVQPSAPAQTTAPPAPSTPTLRPGRYACSGTNITMELQSPLLFITLYVGYTNVGTGSYKINGNTLVVTFARTSGDASSLQGKTVAYNIMSDTSFSEGRETWHRR